MAPSSWATSKQLKFLNDYIPIFVNYSVKETQSKFWLWLCEDWFSHWPELNVLIKEGKLPPQCSAANPNVPDDCNVTDPKYQLSKEEHKLYGDAIKTCKQVSIL